jgi:hypothetical protein
MKEYAEFNTIPETRVVEGTMGMSLVYRLKRVFTNAGAIDMRFSNVYYSKEYKGLVSCKGRDSKARPLSLDKLGKYTLREHDPKNPKFTRPFKVHSDEISYAAHNLI